MWLTGSQLSKCQRALLSLSRTPIPSRMVSNGEYMPVLQAPEQHRVEKRIVAMADANSKRLGTTRREYLRSSCGMAVAFLAMNEVFGRFFSVEEVEAFEPEAAALGSVPEGTFIFDNELHHVSDTWSDPIVLVLRTTAAGLGPPYGLNEQLIPWNPALVGTQIDFASVSYNNFLKEVFLDSVTTMGLLSGAAGNPGEPPVLAADEMAVTRDRVNAFLGSQRLLTQGTVFPSIGTIVAPGSGELTNLEEMQRQAESNGIVAWKGYPIGDFVAVGEGRLTYPWNVDDPDVSYPVWRRSLELGVKVISLHTGLNPPGMTPEHGDHGHPRHVAAAARDFPGLTFVAFHAGLRPFLDDTSAADQLDASIDVGENPPRVDWVTDLAFVERELHVRLPNLMAELGTTFASSVVIFPTLTAHILGQLLKGLGPKRILWGTDSLWYGSPQWQIDAFWRFQIPEEMQEQFGYPELGKHAKLRILGLNAAGLYGFDFKHGPGAKRGGDRLEELRHGYRHFQEEEGPARSNAAYGWVRTKA
jgi:predicted TIM-barrel fold metal-dependent hydrolase